MGFHNSSDFFYSSMRICNNFKYIKSVNRAQKHSNNTSVGLNERYRGQQFGHLVETEAGIRTPVKSQKRNVPHIVLFDI